LVPAAVVGPVGVVVVEVGVEVCAESGDGRLDVGDEGGLPAFLEDDALDAFDAPMFVKRPWRVVAFGWLGVVF
jgi:hypothetical protein